ncbi:hypothetical protein ACIQYS_04645 [Psychrobacillus sp. NPDC096426]|uniref:hypothetical protein n=1 Tax=Psychrobacillus sp. NPDC096426 TaxID=3364491 RepID=UPI00382F3C18
MGIRLLSIVDVAFYYQDLELNPPGSVQLFKKRFIKLMDTTSLALNTTLVGKTGHLV